jgi:hypothetical protein
LISKQNKTLQRPKEAKTENGNGNGNENELIHTIQSMSVLRLC